MGDPPTWPAWPFSAPQERLDATKECLKSDQGVWLAGKANRLENSK